jgi:FtsP/CotA-like multicopper oxidase with cupredoxin domain
MHRHFPGGPGVLSRRRFLQGLAAGGVVAGLGAAARPAWALKSPNEPVVLAGTDFDLVVGETPVDFTGRVRPAVTVNGSLPAPILRWREGTTVTVRMSASCDPEPTGSPHSETSPSMQSTTSPPTQTSSSTLRR